MKIELKDTNTDDLEALFNFQSDRDANYLAAFTTKDPTNWDDYIKKWTRLLSDETINNKTIFFNNQIAGSIAKFEVDGESEITYWIGKDFWGKGIATAALKQFLEVEKTRPIFGRAAFDNFGSKKVLEKCGFENIGTEKTLRMLVERKLKNSFTN